MNTSIKRLTMAVIVGFASLALASPVLADEHDTPEVCYGGDTVIPAVPSTWYVWSPNKDQGPFDGPPTFPNDDRGTWQGPKVNGGPQQDTVGTFNVSNENSGRSSWFHRTAAKAEEIVKNEIPCPETSDPETTTPPTTVPEVTDPTTPPVNPDGGTTPPPAPGATPSAPQSLPVTGSENWIMAALAAALIAAGGGVTWLSRRPRSI